MGVRCRWGEVLVGVGCRWGWVVGGGELSVGGRGEVGLRPVNHRSHCLVVTIEEPCVQHTIPEREPKRAILVPVGRA